MSNAEPKSPLTIIAIFAGIIEASALASLPFLSEDSQSTYTWFLVGFPFFLTVLFFLTLNFNNKSLFTPPTTDPTAPFTTITASLPPVATDYSLQAQEHLQPDEESFNTPTDNNLAPNFIPHDSTLSAQTTVTITISGANADQLLEQFAVQALRHSKMLCNTWTFYNLEAGAQTTLVTQPIEKKKPGLGRAFFQGVVQINERPLFAAIRIRRALSLMKPAASAWL